MTASERKGTLSGVFPRSELMDEYPMVASRVMKTASLPNSPRPGGISKPKAGAAAVVRAANNPGTKRAMSVKIACCMLNRTKRLTERFRDRLLKAK